MRGGNRFIALIALEWVALVVVAALLLRFIFEDADSTQRGIDGWLLALVVTSPLWIALVQLAPLPWPLWLSLPGHAVYESTMQSAGVPAPGWAPLSVSPDATLASLLAGLPVLACFLLGYEATFGQLRALLRLVVLVSFAEVLLGLLQVSGGPHSPFFVGAQSYGPPLGTFGNRNHYANYLAMALAALAWLAFDSVYEARRRAGSSRPPSAFSSRHLLGLWVAASLVIVVGILMTRSRGGTLFGLGAAFLCAGAAALRIAGRKRALKYTVPVGIVVVVAAAALVGFNEVMSRVSASQLNESASYRSVLFRSSLQGAMAFLPFGSGWGTYDLAYQRFQPPVIAAYPNHAHNDYVELLFEGGVFFVLVAGALAWLAARRGVFLVRWALSPQKLDREAMLCTICGLGLLGFLVHSLVEFNMRIPANAMLAALFAGIYLRPLTVPPPDDRPAQPHPSRHRRRLGEPGDVAGDGAHRSG